MQNQSIILRLNYLTRVGARIKAEAGFHHAMDMSGFIFKLSIIENVVCGLMQSECLYEIGECIGQGLNVFKDKNMS